MSRDLSGLSVFITAGNRVYTMEELNAFRVTITDSEEGDSTIELQCNDEDFRVADNMLFQVGESIGVKWGYANHNELSEDRFGYVVVKPSTTYGEDGVLSVIKATTTSLLMAGKRSQKSYGKVALKTIIEDMAGRASLKLITPEDPAFAKITIDGFSQGNLDDRTALRMLGDRFGYVPTFLNDTIKFLPRDFDQRPTNQFLYKQGEASNIISAQVQQDHAKDMGAGESVVKVKSNPEDKTTTKTEVKEKEVKQVNLAAANPSAHVSSAKFSTSVETKPAQAQTGTPGGIQGFMAGMGAKIMSTNGGGPGKLWDASDVRQLSSAPPSMDAISKSHATASALNTKTRKSDMSIVVEGEPRLTARQVIEVIGMSKRDSGKWYVIKVTHVLDLSSGYTCDMELARTGHNLKGSGKAETNVNDKSGTSDGKGPVKPSVKADLDTRKVTRVSK